MKAIDKQREIFIALFDRGSIGQTGTTRFTVWNRYKNPLRRFGLAMYVSIKKYCRRDKDGAFVIDLRKVRKARRNSWIKQYYLWMKGAANGSALH